VTITSYALALATAALRVGSGNHFLSDVVAGALIGTVSGIVIPLIFAREK
jgi:undecaprenyl-diphosphatase